MQYGIWCERARSSLCGYAAAWSKANGELETFPTLEEAETRAAQYRSKAPPSLGYTARELPHGATGARQYT